MGATKKVILFIVEGQTDADSLNPILKKLFIDNNIRFHIVRGDITTKNGISSQNAVVKVDECIKQEMEKYRFKVSDIIRIIHIIDTDGAFVPDTNVVYDDTDSIKYTLNTIYTSNVEYIIRRNHIKKEVVSRLISTGSIRKIPYEIYFMSRNLEHVLHNKMHILSDEEKEDLADSFAEKYKNDINGFKDFIQNEDFTVKGNFRETWAYIFADCNSLKRNSNLHLMLKENPRDN